MIRQSGSISPKSMFFQNCFNTRVYSESKDNFAVYFWAMSERISFSKNQTNKTKNGIHIHFGSLDRISPCCTYWVKLPLSHCKAGFTLTVLNLFYWHIIKDVSTSNNSTRGNKIRIEQGVWVRHTPNMRKLTQNSIKSQHYIQYKAKLKIFSYMLVKR